MKLASKSLNCIDKVVQVVDFDRAEFHSISIWVWETVQVLPRYHEVDIFTETTSIVGFTTVVWYMYKTKCVHTWKIETSLRSMKYWRFQNALNDNMLHTDAAGLWCACVHLWENCIMLSIRPNILIIHGWEKPAHLRPLHNSLLRVTSLLPLSKFSIQSQSFSPGLFQPA